MASHCYICTLATNTFNFCFYTTTLLPLLASQGVFVDSKYLKSASRFSGSFNASVWNLKGWTVNNSTLRCVIIRQLNQDVMCHVETHLTDENVLDIQGYTWYGHNRTVKHVKAVKGSEGIGIMVKNELLDIIYIIHGRCDFYAIYR